MVDHAFDVSRLLLVLGGATGDAGNAKHAEQDDNHRHSMQYV